jgi:hypothetical protein
MFGPASRGIRKKMANVIMLTAISRKIVPISRWMMNMTTVCAGAQPTLDQRFSSWQCKFDSVARFTIARCAVLSRDTKMAINLHRLRGFLDSRDTDGTVRRAASGGPES